MSAVVSKRLLRERWKSLEACLHAEGERGL